MASGFFALLDDIAALMDDVSVMTKVATKKTAGILGDDLAVNAEKASGFVSSREIPVLWAIMKGSLLNKLIILPIAFLLSAFYPPAIIFILVLGGIYLAYEGAEKIYEYFFYRKEKVVVEVEEELPSPEEVLAKEKEKIKSAIFTDFILSVEIVIIALGTVVEEALSIQIVVVTIIAIIATVGVYGIVALIVRMDDTGHYMIRKSDGKKGFRMSLGKGLVKALPIVIKGLTIVGTIALLLVAGGIFAHYIDFFHHVLESFPAMLRELLFGLAIGIVSLPIVGLIKKGWSKIRPAKVEA
ncbi:DUF808 domain-containing protein [Crocinitomix catalasitica]|uniref:DUF808 domain-containing protein n=1 Tax=Crocinitomix catalasitica TaxID=184607 RepID=UPI0004816736|nr:DUF808 domain-containing protein [Crocinitomix catalasitica]